MPYKTPDTKCKYPSRERLYHKRDFERRKRAMRYIKEEYDYITSARRNNILFDMALYKLDQMIAEMKFNQHL